VTNSSIKQYGVADVPLFDQSGKVFVAREFSQLLFHVGAGAIVISCSHPREGIRR